VVSHIITVTEAFIYDYVTEVFTSYPVTLKSESTITHKQTLSCNSIKEFTRKIAYDKAKKLLMEV